MEQFLKDLERVTLPGRVLFACIAGLFATIGAVDLTAAPMKAALEKAQKRHDRENRTVLVGAVLFAVVCALLFW